MGKTTNRPARRLAAEAGQIRAAAGSSEAAAALAFLLPLLRRGGQATVLAAAVAALGRLFERGVLREEDFDTVRPQLVPCLFNASPRVCAALAEAAAWFPPQAHIERHLLDILACGSGANAARAAESLCRRYPASRAAPAALRRRLACEPEHSAAARRIRACLAAFSDGLCTSRKQA
ncbi:Uncharacterised protein [Kingella potus]|uniref:Uncharacterized protein n=1 Tax=Kingella potus TaxID=265175 RepID=A0A377R1U3_9NEIS|nr:hypothetical protein [Kingella potus]UOP00746.1 hypothetical protein LVJ84_13370 [Kingella potus]STR02850.1 Uncharacterised protein [Kingella potus]